MIDDSYIAAITPQVYERFKTAIEIGKWPDGKKLNDQQRTTCMDAIIAYEHIHVSEEQRTGYMPTQACPSKTSEEDQIKWRDK